MIRLAHVINPVNAPLHSELSAIQPITFASITKARAFSKAESDIELYVTGFVDDLQNTPVGFAKLPELKRSVADVATFSKPRKYPLFKDVFEAVYTHSSADYIMYTNMDITLMPYFYEYVIAELKKGYDALVVNRRGISKKHIKVEDLPYMYAEIGMPHPGFDCFIFHRSLFPKMILENVCIGVSFSEVTIMHNLIAHATHLKLVDDVHLTFHIGTEVMPPLDPKYLQHNRKEYEEKIYPKLKPLLHIRKFPYSSLPFYKRMLKWILNPSFRTHQVIELEAMDTTRRLKYHIDSLRFALLEKIK